MAAETEIERMVVRLVGDAGSYTKMLKDAQTGATQAGKEIGKAANHIEGINKTIDGFAASAKGYVASLAGLAGVSFGFGLVQQSVALSANAEKMETSFGTMLQSADKGKQLVADLQKFAANTPLNTGDTQRAARTLLQFGVAGDDVIRIMRQLGDAAGGESERFNRMALAFGQMSATGRLMGEELNQMIEAGFNPLQEISRTTGKSVAQLKKEMEQGKVTIDMVKEAFKTATGPGGQFNDLMLKASKSAEGLFSTMQDDVDQAKKALGDFLIDGLKLKSVMGGVSAAAKEVGAAISLIPGELKPLLAVVVGGTAAVLTGSLAWAVLGKTLQATAANAWAAAAALKGASVAAYQSSAAAVTSSAAWGTAAGWAGRALAVGATAAAFYKLGEAIPDLGTVENVLDTGYDVGFGGGSALNEQLEHAKKLGALRDAVWAGRYGKDTAGMMSKAAGMDTNDRFKFLDELLKRQEKEVDGYRGHLKAAEAQAAELNTTLASVFGSRELDRVRDSAEDFRKKLEMAQERAAGLRDELNKIKRPEDNKQLVSDIDAATRKMKEQADTLGMTAEELQAYQFYQQGATDAMVADYLAAAENLKVKKKLADEVNRAAEEQKKFAESVSSTQDSLEEEIITFGMSADEIKAYRMEVGGAALEDIARTRNLIAQKKAMEDQKKLMEDGRKETEKYMTPMEKFNERVAELADLLAAGAITDDVWGRAMKAANKELDDAAKKANKAHTEMTKFDAALAGSAESLQRIQAQRDMIRGVGVNPFDPVRIKGPASQQPTTTPDQDLAALRAKFQMSDAEKEMVDKAFRGARAIGMNGVRFGARPGSITGKQALERGVEADGKDPATGLLKDIRDELKTQNNLPPVVLMPADVA